MCFLVILGGEHPSSRNSALALILTGATPSRAHPFSLALLSGITPPLPLPGDPHRPAGSDTPGRHKLCTTMGLSFCDSSFLPPVLRRTPQAEVEVQSSQYGESRLSPGHQESPHVPIGVDMPTLVHSGGSLLFSLASTDSYLIVNLFLLQRSSTVGAFGIKNHPLSIQLASNSSSGSTAS